MFRFVTFLFITILTLSSQAKITLISGGHELYHPEGLRPTVSTPLVVVLHGCLQNAQKIRESSGWQQLAEKEEFLVLYPNQKPLRHPMNCWAWYEPENQKPLSGENLEIIHAIEEVKKSFAISEVYLAGLSSGAATVATLATCSPQLFNGILIHSGVPYGVARSPLEAIDVLKKGQFSSTSIYCPPYQFTGKVVLVQGKEDHVVHANNFLRLQEDFLSNTQAISNYVEEPQGHSYLQTEYFSQNKMKGLSLLVDHLAHAWSGGLKNQKFSDPKGPDVTQKTWNFFRQNSVSK